MGRFDKYVDTHAVQRQVASDARASGTDLLSAISSNSTFFGLSLTFGHIACRLAPLRAAAVWLVRKLFSRYPAYENDPRFESELAAGCIGLPLLGFVLYGLFALVGRGAAAKGGLALLVCLAFQAIVIQHLLEYLKFGLVGMAPITSQEVTSLISWLVLLVGSGLNLMQALEYYVQEETGVLRDIVQASLQDVLAGKCSLEEALGDLAMNMRREDLQNVLTVILQSNRQGIPINDALLSFFERYQTQLAASAEKRGSAANEKATLVLTGEMFLLMAFFMIGMLGAVSAGGLF